MSESQSGGLRWVLNNAVSSFIHSQESLRAGLSQAICSELEGGSLLSRPFSQDTETLTLPLIRFSLRMTSKALNLGASVTRKSRFKSAEKNFVTRTGVVWMHDSFFLCPEAMRNRNISKGQQNEKENQQNCTQIQRKRETEGSRPRI